MPMTHFGMFFIFLSGMHYMAAAIATVLMSLKAGQFIPFALQGLVFYHVLLIVGLVMARDEVRNAGYNPITLFKTSLLYSLNSVPFLIVLSGVLFIVHFISQQSINLVEIVYCVLLISIYLNYRNSSSF